MESEKYLSLYKKAKSSSLEDAQPIFEEMRNLPEKHPYGEALMLTYAIGLGDTSKFDELKQLIEDNNYDYQMSYFLANEYYLAQRYVEAEETAKKSLEKHDNDNKMRWLMANSIAMQNNYKEAKDIADELMGLVDGSQSQMNEIDRKRKEWNEILIEDYNKQLKEDKNNNQLKIDLSWALLENNKNEELIKIARTIELDGVDSYDYYNILSNVDFIEEKIDDGIQKLDKQIELAKSYGDSNDAKIKRRKRRLPFMIAKKGYYLCTQGKKEEGYELFEEAIEMNNSADIMLEYTKTLYGDKQYEKARQCVLRVIKIKPDLFDGHQMLAIISTRLGNDKEAYDAISRAIELNPNDLECYILKIKLLNRNNAIDGSREVIKFLDENGAGEFISTRICKAYMLDVFDNEKEKALEEYKDIDKKQKYRRNRTWIIDNKTVAYINGFRT